MLSRFNNTDYELGISGVWSGVIENIHPKHNGLTLTIKSDQAGSARIYWYYKQNDVTEIHLEEHQYSANDNFHKKITKKANWFRIQYINGLITQTSFKLQTMFMDDNVEDERLLLALNKFNWLRDYRQNGKCFIANYELIAGSQINQMVLRNYHTNKRLIIYNISVNLGAESTNASNVLSIGLIQNPLTTGATAISYGGAKWSGSTYSDVNKMYYVPGYIGVSTNIGRIYGNPGTGFSQYIDFQEEGLAIEPSDGVNVNAIFAYGNTTGSTTARINCTFRWVEEDI